MELVSGTFSLATLCKLVRYIRGKIWPVGWEFKRVQSAFERKIRGREVRKWPKTRETGWEIAYTLKHPDELEERNPEDFGRGKPEAKRLNGDRGWPLRKISLGTWWTSMRVKR